MKTHIRKSKTMPIGIDVGTQWLKMAQVSRSSDGKLSLIAGSSAQLPEVPQADMGARARMTGEVIRQMTHDLEFRGRQCILSLPAELTFVQHMKMDKMPEEQLTQSLQWELSSKLPYDPAQAEIRHVVAGDIYTDNVQKQEVIAVAARRDTIEAHVEALHRSKLDCIGVNIEPCAIVECFARLFRRNQDTQRAMLFVDIGATSTQVVVSHGPNLVFAKNLVFGGAQFDEAIGAVLNLPSAEASRQRMTMDLEDTTDPHVTVVTQALAGPVSTLAQELTNCLRYYDSVFINRPVERVVFLGGQAHDKVLCQTLAQRLGLPAQIGDPLTQIELDPQMTAILEADSAATRPSWAVAVGLSLGGRAA